MEILQPVLFLLGQWRREEYRGKEFKEGDPVVYSDRGERVRSKSEKILADYLYHHNIPYKYEKPLQLSGVCKISNKKDRKI